jgi:hypothetical protein
MPADLFKVVVSFQDSDGKPLTGSGYEVRLFDRDRLFDDKLGSSALRADGTAAFLFSVADIFSFDSPAERKPDIYFILQKDGEEVFRSEVFSQVDFDAVDPVTGRPKGMTKEFGPFRIGA